MTRQAALATTVALAAMAGAGYLVFNRSAPARHGIRLTAPLRIDRGPLAGSIAQRDIDTGQARVVTGRLTAGVNQSRQEAASAVLQGTLTELAAGVTMSDLHVIREVDTLAGTRLTYERFKQGMPVLGDRLDVEIARDNTVTRIDNALTNISTTVAQIADDQQRLQEQFRNAVRAASAAVKAAAVSRVTVKPAVLANKTGEGITVLGITFLSAHPSGSWRVVTDTAGEKILSQVNVAQFVDGSGYVFGPNPIQASGDFKLKITDSADGPTGVNRFRLLAVLRDLDSSGLLQGTYATTEPTKNRAHETNRVFKYSRVDSHFGEVMVYHWVTECQHYLQSLGFVNTAGSKKGINVRPMPIDAHFTTDDNSFYSPDTRTLQFGDGGVPDSEDAEVILHELAHAIQDDQVPGFGGAALNTEARAMGEGFGDYWAASFFSTVGPSGWHVFWDKWDGQAFHPAAGMQPPYLRRLNTSKKYKGDWVGEEHADGEIWSACLWALHDLVGRAKADTMILQSHYAMRPGAGTFADGAQAILAANRDLYGGDKGAEIRQIFIDRGVLAKP
jgi:Zn-dependent metalloprotease